MNRALAWRNVNTWQHNLFLVIIIVTPKLFLEILNLLNFITIRKILFLQTLNILIKNLSPILIYFIHLFISVQYFKKLFFRGSSGFAVYIKYSGPVNLLELLIENIFCFFKLITLIHCGLWTGGVNFFFQSITESPTLLIHCLNVLRSCYA